MFRSLLCFSLVVLAVAPSFASVAKIDLTGTDVGSADPNRFTTFPTANPSLFFGRNYGIRFRKVNFNTAPDGPLVEGGGVTTQYASLGVTMNDIRISSDIYGGNLYGAGFAAEDDAAQVYTFTTPVTAVGIVNTSPDKDRVQFYSGPGATGALLQDFVDTDGLPLNFNTDRFVGGMASSDTTIGSMVISNQGGNLEMDELIFAVYATPGDTDVDGDVDFDDLLTLAQNYGITTGRLWETGDFDFDGATEFDDLLVLAQNYGMPNVFESDWAAARSMVPEPTLMLASFVFLASQKRRRASH
jgi:hypothetical protein